MLPQQYCLRWKYHHSNLQTMFSQLLDRGCFCDVTLACDGQTLKAHRVVLSACSTYFDSILTNCNSEKDPIIILKDVKFMDIKYLVEFMYKGEINVDHSNLASLLKTAEDLRIKGLAEVSWRDEDNENMEHNDSNNNNVNESTGASASSHLLGSPHSALSATAVPSLIANAPLSSPNRKKRGRPPLDESNHFTRTSPKYAHLPGDNFYDMNSDENKTEGAYDLSVTAPSTSNTTTSTTTSTQSVLNNIKHEPEYRDRTGPSRHGIETNLDQQQPRNLSQNGSQSSSSASSAVAALAVAKRLKHHNIVTAMMDDKALDDENSFYMPHRSSDKDGEFDEDSIAHKIVPKLERTDSPHPDMIEENDDEMMGSSAEHLQSIFLTNEEREEWKDVIRMNDYLTKGRRPQFWEEPFTKRVLDAIKNKNLEMKKAAKLLGVSYGTLYGRYRETYGCLKHPYRGPAGSFMVSRMRDMWPGATDDQNELLNLVQRGRMSLLQNDDVNGANLMDMISDEAMLDSIPSLAKYSRKSILNSLSDVNALLKHATSAKNPSSSNNSNSSRSESPNAISSSSTAMIKPEPPNVNGTVEAAK